MSYLELIRSHVERCLQDIWELPRVQADSDGDYPCRYGTTTTYVGIDPEEPVLVRVWAIAAHGVRRSAKLLAELNSVNTRARSASVLWDRGVVVVRQTMLASAVDMDSLDQACDAVGTIANDIGVLIAGVYGGQTPFQADESSAADRAG